MTLIVCVVTIRRPGAVALEAVEDGRFGFVSGRVLILKVSPSARSRRC